MNKDEIYSDKIIKGSRTYFFDIKKSENEDLYLKISESKKTQDGFDHFRIMVFEENLKDFATAFKKAIEKFKSLKKQKDKTYSVEKIRETHKKAYLHWTQEDDNKLKTLFYEGKKVEELAKIFERKKGAVSSRIKKLELQEKYGK